jgi:hypothetical protein
MPSGATDEPPGQITANADAEQMDMDDKPLPSPAATNTKEEDNDNTAGVTVNTCQGVDVSRQMWMMSHRHCHSLVPMYIAPHQLLPMPKKPKMMMALLT